MRREGHNKRRQLFGKAFLRAFGKSAEKARSFWLMHWYGMAWRIGKGSRFAGTIRRRAYGGDASFGSRCDFGHGLMIDISTGGNLKVGNNVSINGGTYISVIENIEIGDDCRIGEYCSIRDNDHIILDPEELTRTQGMRSSAVRIGANVWLGRGVVVQPGISIGTGSVVGANSFVNSDIPAYAVAVGSPAKVIRMRK